MFLSNFGAIGSWIDIRGYDDFPQNHLDPIGV